MPSRSSSLPLGLVPDAEPIADAECPLPLSGPFPQPTSDNRLGTLEPSQKVQVYEREWDSKSLTGHFDWTEICPACSTKLGLFGSCKRICRNCGFVRSCSD